MRVAAIVQSAKCAVQLLQSTRLKCESFGLNVYPIAAQQVSQIESVRGTIAIRSGAIAHMQVVVHCQTLRVVLKFYGGAAPLDALNVLAAVSKDPVASDRVGVHSSQLLAAEVFERVRVNVVKRLKDVRRRNKDAVVARCGVLRALIGALLVGRLVALISRSHKTRTCPENYVSATFEFWKHFD